MNPMIRKELRQRMRDRRGWLLPTAYLALLTGAVAFAYFTTIQTNTWRDLQGAEIGFVIFLTASYAQLSLLLLLAPATSAGSITIEKEQKTLPGLLTSLLTAIEIWWGKFVAALLFLVLLQVASLPVLSLSFALGGVGPREVAMVSATTVIILASITSIGLYCSSFFRRSVHSTSVTYALMLALSVLTAIIFGIMMASGEDRAWNAIPERVKLPLYFNPFYFLTMALTPLEEIRYWLKSLLIFVGIGLLAFGFAVRNLRSSGEQS